MKITVTCSELLRRCYDWIEVCSELGLDEYCCKWAGHSEVVLTEEQAKKFGLIKKVI